MRELNRKAGRKLRLSAWLAMVTITGAVTTGLVAAGNIDLIYGMAAVAIFLAIGHTWMHRPGGVPALIYHSVSAAPAWLPWRQEISVKPETFALHLATIRDMGCTVISTDDFIHRRRQGLPMPQKPVMIHLDDGYLDNWVAAYPLLQEHGLCATLFISTDFVEEGDTPRPQMKKDAQAEPLTWEGYVNWHELEQMERSGTISVHAHGSDHARGETDSTIVTKLTNDNWRKLIWVQWNRMEGNKCHWHALTAPPHIPLGTPVHTNIPAMSGLILDRDGKLESQPQYEERIRAVFNRVRTIIKTRLGKEATIFCWPHNVHSDRAHEIALESGFAATTAGTGENRRSENWQRISRIHVHENVIGAYWRWAEALALRANIRLFQGCYYWYIVIMALNTSRKIVSAATRSASA